MSIASIARTALALGTVIGAGIIGAGVVVWWAMRRAGLVDGLEEAVASGLGMESWTLPASALLVVWVALALALVGLGVLVVVLLAVAFNGLGRTVGGIDVVARAERLPPER